MQIKEQPDKSLQPARVGILVCSSHFSSGVAELGSLRRLPHHYENESNNARIDKRHHFNHFGLRALIEQVGHGCRRSDSLH